MRNYDVRLTGMDAPSGSILADDLVRIVESVKKLNRQITNEVLDRSGRGRPPAALEGLGRTQLTMESGSTRLGFVIGDPQSFEVDSVENEIDRRFDEIVGQFESDAGPEGVSDKVATAAAELAQALIDTAQEVSFAIGDRPPITFCRKAVHPEKWWRTEAEKPTVCTLTGTLEMEDLLSRRFRIRDALGSAIFLVDVEEPSRYASLLGSRVTATGSLEVPVGTGQYRMSSPHIVEATDVLDKLGVADPPTLDDLIGSARSLPEPTPLELTDEEFESFLAATRE